ncbi:hypothetical protein VTK73DRAFT_9380 [Phialemonium thermophilum]|uniref:Chitinase n=1 Tax=Phialemonium thermophilum TaxID=223376 RepID=A0ABR3W2R2_9PEZI
MSWMDSWSRPAKQQATPAPFYLIPGAENTPYCKTCGRVISTRKAGSSRAARSSSKEPVVYCSTRCRHAKPGKVDREIEAAFVRFLNGEEELPAGMSPPRVKGDNRVLVPVDAVQERVFGRVTQDRSSLDGSTSSEEAEDNSLDCISETREDAGEGQATEQENEKDGPVDYDVVARMAVRSGSRIRPPQAVSEVNGSVGGEKGWAERIDETDEMREKRRLGLKAVREKEMVRAAARRGVVFGFLVEGGGDGDRSPPRRVKCEAVMQGKVVEPSFAKGNWCVRWRE